MKKKVEATIKPPMRAKLEQTLERLGLSEAEYLRGALDARLRRDARQAKSEDKDGDN